MVSEEPNRCCSRAEIPQIATCEPRDIKLESGA